MYNQYNTTSHGIYLDAPSTFHPSWGPAPSFYPPNYHSPAKHLEVAHLKTWNAACTDDQVSQIPSSTCQRIPQYQITHQPLRCLWNTGGHQCQEIFSSSKDLGSHVKGEHAKGIQICQWDKCGKDFKQNYKLVKHLPVHTREKAFQCDKCSKSFPRTENLKVHRRTHTGEKPFACTHLGCGKRFRDCSNRNTHMQSHSNEKKYICKHSGCAKSYSHRSSLRKHKETHHKDQNL